MSTLQQRIDRLAQLADTFAQMTALSRDSQVCWAADQNLHKALKEEEEEGRK
jgi:hypothetical protein